MESSSVVLEGESLDYGGQAVPTKRGLTQSAEIAEERGAGEADGFFAPKGHNKSAQGNALGGETEYDLEALKGRNRLLLPPFQGYRFFRGRLPRALPWADLWLPLRGDGNRATSQDARPGPTCPLRLVTLACALG